VNNASIKKNPRNICRKVIGLGRKAAAAINRNLPGSVWLRLKKGFRQLPAPFAERYGWNKRTCVILYSVNEALFPGYHPRKTIQTEIRRDAKVSLVACVKNDVETVNGWIQSIYRQTILPDEIIVVDTGSSDGTFRLLQEEACISRGIPFHVIYSPAANIAQARNIGIKNAKNQIIAITDFGATPREDWLEKITYPLLEDPEILLSAGLYATVDKNGLPALNSALWLWNRLDRIDPSSYLPPGGSAAFRKDIWEFVGGYPEWLTLTGEDTCFDLQLKHLGGKWAFVPEAVVLWHAPETIKLYVGKMFTWAKGDGEAGIQGRYYWRNMVRIGLWSGYSFITLCFLIAFFLFSSTLAAIWVASILLIYTVVVLWIFRRSHLPAKLFLARVLGEIAQVAGYLQGARHRRESDNKRHGLLKGIFIILSGVPIDDTGGGARGTQIALELLNRGYGVIFLNRFPKNEKKDLSLQISHPNLFTYPAASFTWDTFVHANPDYLAGKQINLLVEFPAPEYLPLIQKSAEFKATVIYDLIDAWDTSLGRQWYSRKADVEIIHASRILIASAMTLKLQLEHDSQRKVTLFPNAVNRRLFSSHISWPRPEDLPASAWTILYIGALWGEWFDWKLLGRTAERYPEAAVAVIGDYREQYKSHPPNIFFLGLKPQWRLPAYLAHADVAIIPWHPSTITHATSPLKLYEYLAMGLPVVAPDLKSLGHIPGLFLARDIEEFLSLVGQARFIPRNHMEIDKFIRKNTWQARVDQLISSLQNKI
jgi:glycosyltransferase involved in cell wall biosynthesis